MRSRTAFRLVGPLAGALTAALAGAAVLLAGCEGKLRRKEEPPAGAARNVVEEEAWETYGADDASAGYATEAARTTAMDEKARELQQTYDDAVANATTDEERARAFQEFEDGRAELNRMAEDDPATAADAEYAPPP